MQFYLDGYRPGDPENRAPDPIRTDEETLPQQVDVLVVGTGPAGSVLAAQLAEFPDISTLVIERNSGPLEVGRADGVACRTVEMLHAFGLSERLLREAYWVNETSFWEPSAHDTDHIERSSRVKDVPDGLSEFPHVIVNQARMQEFFLEHMRQSPSRLEPVFGAELLSIDVVHDSKYPVQASIRVAGAAEPLTVNARYLVGCDGARSTVRKSMGVHMHGDTRNHAWGVMDVLAVTDFPDVRVKSAIQSTAGAILIIPREGGYLVRFYVDLGDLNPDDHEARSRFTLEHIIGSAQKILRPYKLDVKDVAWWSVYEVGQRIASQFDDVGDAERGTRPPLVFIAGDACHTHSAQAGLGMNVSLQDGFNLGWKLSHVLTGIASASLLDTYALERQQTAQELIDFDHVWSSAMAAGPKSGTNPHGIEVSEMRRLYTEGARFTAGFGTKYTASLITGDDGHQALAKGFPIGERFHSAPVIRLADAKQVGLGHVAAADGRWRLYAFADPVRPSEPGSRLAELCDFLSSSPESPVVRYTPANADPDALFDVRAVVQQNHHELAPTELPNILLPTKGPFGLLDYEKVFCAPIENELDIYESRQIDRNAGCLVIVRPDQYIAHVLPLDAHEELAGFVKQFMTACAEIIA